MGVHLLYHPQTAMAEELGELNRVHPPAQGFGGKGVAQKVRVDPAVDPRPLGVAPEELEHSTLLKRRVLALRVASGGHEQMINVGVRARPSVPVDPPYQGWRQRDEPLLRALAPDFEEGSPLLGRNDAGHLQPAQRADPDPGIGEEPDDQLVPIVGSGRLQPVDLVAAQHLDDLLRQAGELGLARDVLALALAPVQELADGADIVVDAVGRELLAVLARLNQQAPGEAVEGTLVQLPDLGDLLLPAPGKEYVDQAVAVGLLDGGGGQAPSLARGEVVLDQHFHR